MFKDYDSQRTRCIICKENRAVKDMIFVEPNQGEVEPVYIRGSICDDCSVIHWAVPFIPFSAS